MLSEIRSAQPRSTHIPHLRFWLHISTYMQPKAIEKTRPSTFRSSYHHFTIVQSSISSLTLLYLPPEHQAPVWSSGRSLGRLYPMESATEEENRAEFQAAELSPCPATDL